MGEVPETNAAGVAEDTTNSRSRRQKKVSLSRRAHLVHLQKHRQEVVHVSNEPVTSIQLDSLDSEGMPVAMTSSSQSPTDQEDSPPHMHMSTSPDWDRNEANSSSDYLRSDASSHEGPAALTDFSDSDSDVVIGDNCLNDHSDLSDLNRLAAGCCSKAEPEDEIAVWETVSGVYLSETLKSSSVRQSASVDDTALRRNSQSFNSSRSLKHSKSYLDLPMKTEDLAQSEQSAIPDAIKSV